MLGDGKNARAHAPWNRPARRRTIFRFSVAGRATRSRPASGSRPTPVAPNRRVGAPSLQPPHRSCAPPHHTLEGPAHLRAPDLPLIFLDLRHLVAPGRVLLCVSTMAGGDGGEDGALSPKLVCRPESQWLLDPTPASSQSRNRPTQSKAWGLISPLALAMDSLMKGAQCHLGPHTSQHSGPRSLGGHHQPLPAHRRKRRKPCSNIPL